MERSEIEHAAQMISYRLLSEIEKICEKRKITKKELALAVGTTPSYISQLFRGTKMVNMEILAKFEMALKFQFKIESDKPMNIKWYNSQSLNQPK